MNIYVSSTFQDLKEYRRAVYAQLRKLRLDAVAMEDYVASEKRPLAQCIQDVAKADVYMGIFAWRYGYIPKEGNPDGRSITELEYQAAGENGKERLIFLLCDNAPWPPSQMDTHTQEGDGGKQIKRFREELNTRHVIGFFSTPDELAKEVSAAVSNIQLHRNPQLPPKVMPPPNEGNQAAEHIAEVIEWIIRDADEKRRTENIERLPEMGEAAQAATPILCDIVRRREQPDSVQLAAIKVLIRLRPNMDDRQCMIIDGIVTTKIMDLFQQGKVVLNLRDTR